MPLQKLQFRPGVVQDLTSYTNTGGWFECDNVRFKNGFPQSIGGWAKYTQNQFIGTCRYLQDWTALDGSNYLGFGTTSKFYVEKGGAFTDITPLRKTSSLSNAFSATNGSSTLTITDVAHGAATGDYITISGATSLGGNVTAAVLNQEYVIDTIVSANAYTIVLPVTANASDTGNGGSSISIAYQIPVGLDTQVGGTGWGAGTWGRGGWGTATTISIGSSLRLWSADNWGQDLFFNVRNGGIYYWTPATPNNRGVVLSSLTSDPNVPTIAALIRVSDNDRSLIAFGANATNGGAQDPLLIRWCDQEDYTIWSPNATNTAGDLRLGTGTKIVHAVETKREIIVFTDIATYSMQYVGPPYTFGITQLSANTTIMGYNAVANVEDTVFWMGTGKFYVYDGRTNELPCPLVNHVFDNFNYAQSDKTFAAVNSKFNEITWFYPTANSSENNAWVTYNYAEKAWTYGTTWSRTAWIDSGVSANPIASSADRYLYLHEFGVNDGSTNPPSPLASYITSAPIEISNGDKFSFIHRIIPDITFYDSTNTPHALLSLYMQDYPGANYSQNSASSVTQTATVPIEQFTNQAFVRLRGRQLSLKVSSNTVGTRWGLGTPRIDLRADGAR